MYQWYFQLSGDGSAIQDTELRCQHFTPYLKYAYKQVLCFFITCVHPTLWARPWEMNPTVDSTCDLFYEFSLWLCFLKAQPAFLTGLNKDPKIP